MRAFAQKPEATQESGAAKSVTLGRAGSARGSAVDSILHLQRTIGNQAVQRQLHASTVKAGGVRPDIQLSSLTDFTGRSKRQAFTIPDDEIEATDEFKRYMNPSRVWQSEDRMTRQEAFLACRLMIEAIQQGTSVKWERDARTFMTRARKLIGITKSPKPDCPSSKYKACVKRADIPGGLSNLSASLGMLQGFFTMEVDWHEDDPKCACCCGEYRQYVKGFMKINGVKQKKPLFKGTLLSETAWNEDSDKSNHPYGHRDESEKVNDLFIPDRKNGCLYRGFDTPGSNDPAIAGNRVEAKLEFKGQTFDRCQKTEGPAKEWKMDFNDDVPRLGKGDTGVG
jgi:hypothetical protein